MRPLRLLYRTAIFRRASLRSGVIPERWRKERCFHRADSVPRACVDDVAVASRG